jgi:hypothetical protein
MFVYTDTTLMLCLPSSVQHYLHIRLRLMRMFFGALTLNYCENRRKKTASAKALIKGRETHFYLAMYFSDWSIVNKLVFRIESGPSPWSLIGGKLLTRTNSVLTPQKE